MNLIDRYTYRIAWSPEDAEHLGLCTEFPSLSWLSATPEGALSGIRDLVAAVLKDMRGNGEVPPKPYSLREFSGKFVVRVPPELHRALSIEAADAGVSLNRLLNARLAPR